MSKLETAAKLLALTLIGCVVTGLSIVASAMPIVLAAAVIYYLFF